MNWLKPTLATSALLAVIVINGWHLAVVQLFAWSSMAWSNSQTMELSPAIMKALDGREVCGICEFVIEKSPDENTKAFAYWQMMTKILVIFLLAATCLPARSASLAFKHSKDVILKPSPTRLPTPPPREILA